jgi:hypothetical protein
MPSSVHLLGVSHTSRHDQLQIFRLPNLCAPQTEKRAVRESERLTVSTSLALALRNMHPCVRHREHCHRASTAARNLIHKLSIFAQVR